MAKLRHVAIQVPDLEKAAQFYESVFEMERVCRGDTPFGNVIMLSDGTINLALLNFPEGTKGLINGPDWALKRRNLVLRRMLAQGSIDEAEYRAAVDDPITARVFARGIDLPAPYPAEWVRRELFERYGSDIYSGFIAHTTLDSSRQAAAQRALARSLIDYDRRHGYRGAEGRVGVADAELTAAQLAGYRPIGTLLPAAVVEVRERSIDAVLADARTVTVPWQGLRWARRFLTVDSLGPAPEQAADIVAAGDVVRVERIDGGWRLAQLPEVQGALVALDPRTGGVEALVGGWDFHTQQFDHARQTKRQPGSGFKPVVYSAALERGVNPASIFWDSPLVLRDASGEANYRPRNDSNDYRGPMPLRQALYQSRNVVSIRVLLRTGLQRSLAHAARFGFERDAMPHNTQLAIGGGNIQVAPIDMAATYAVFANGGFRVEPHILTRVERLDGSTVLAPRHPRACEELCPVQDGADATPAAPRAISARNAFVMDSMLRDVVRRGTARRARALNRPDLAGKTGTLDDATDTWFNGYHPHLVATAWVGFSDRRPMGAREWGSTAALPMWIGFMREALEGEPVIDPLVPEGVVSVKVDPATGQVAGADLNDAVFEYFYAEHAPEQARPGTRAARIETPGQVRPEDIF